MRVRKAPQCLCCLDQRDRSSRALSGTAPPRGRRRRQADANLQWQSSGRHSQQLGCAERLFQVSAPSCIGVWRHRRPGEWRGGISPCVRSSPLPIPRSLLTRRPPIVANPFAPRTIPRDAAGRNAQISSFEKASFPLLSQRPSISFQAAAYETS
jgi:hypothetical protein